MGGGGAEALILSGAEVLSAVDSLDNECFPFSLALRMFRGSIFTPNMAFDIICKKQIKVFLEPASEIVDRVCEELRAIVSKLSAKVRFSSTLLTNF